MSLSCLKFYHIHHLSIKFKNGMCTMHFMTRDALTSNFICIYYPVSSHPHAFAFAVHFACIVLFPLLFPTLLNSSFNSQLMCHLFEEVFPDNFYTLLLFIIVCMPPSRLCMALSFMSTVLFGASQSKYSVNIHGINGRMYKLNKITF